MSASQDAPRSARTLGTDPVGWRSMSLVMCRLSLVVLVLALRPVHAETGIAAFYGGGRTASGEVSGLNGLNCCSSHLAVWYEGPRYKRSQRSDRPRSHQRSRAIWPRSYHRPEPCGRARTRHDQGLARRGLASCVSDAHLFGGTCRGFRPNRPFASHCYHAWTAPVALRLWGPTELHPVRLTPA
jgi:hypothetical protein